MSRFKILRRIEAAIASGSPQELLWAKNYCQDRLDRAKLKSHQKHWRKLLKKINDQT